MTSRQNPLLYPFSGIPFIFVFLSVFLAILIVFSHGFIWGKQSTEEKLEIKDDLGRTVIIPQKIERIISLQPEITRILISLREEKRLVGIDYFIHRYDHLYPLLKPRLAKLPVVSLSGETVNLELILKLQPDIIFASPSETQLASSLQVKTGIPTIALSSMGQLNHFFEEIKLIGQIVGQTERAEALLKYFEHKLQEVKKRLSRAKHINRPRVYLSFWSSFTRTPVVYEPVNLAGGENLAAGLLPEHLGTVGTMISLEKIIVWNPDIILIHGNYPPEQRMVTIEKVLEDKRLATLKAVRERKVFYTFGFWYWWDPAQVLTEVFYLAKLFHPQLFSDVDLIKEGNEIYKEFYGLSQGFSHLMGRLQWKNRPQNEE